jgi:hypothetical protein
MLTWHDERMWYNRNKDLLRQAEQHRLMHQVTAGREQRVLWEK